jgi:hypothetical protein
MALKSTGAFMGRGSLGRWLKAVAELSRRRPGGVLPDHPGSLTIHPRAIRHAA